MRIRKILSLAAAMLLLAVSVPFASAETDAPENLAKQCTYDGARQAKYLRSWMADRDLGTRTKMHANGWVSVRWTDKQAVDFVYFEWSDDAGIAPAPYTVELLDASGAVLERRAGDPYWNCGIEIPQGVYGVKLTVQEAMHLCTLIPFSGGAPADWHPWQPTVDKADFLVIATHPDDDTLFMGSMSPTSGAERGLTGTILYLTTRERIRRTEALNGAWIMGLRTYPMMAGLPDISVRNKEKYKNDFLVEDVEAALIRYLRRVKPEVVMTHDVNGEYGHWQHCIVAEAIQLAVVDAATPACDPASAEQYGVWQVKKLYLHLSETNPIFISATVPLEAFGGRSAWEVAQEAYQCHQSQRLWYHLCNNENENSLEKFGLVFSTVGSDTGVNDMFENIAPETLTDFVPTPAPTDTPTPLSAVTATPSPTAEPTAVPTDTPTPAPTAVPTDTPTAVPTEAPTEAPTAAPTEEPEQLLPRAVTANFRLILAGLAAILVILIGGLAAVLIVRKKVEK